MMKCGKERITVAFIYELVKEGDKDYFDSFEFYDIHINHEPMKCFMGISDWAIDRENGMAFLEMGGRYGCGGPNYYALSFFENPKDLVIMTAMEKIDENEEAGWYNIFFEFQSIAIPKILLKDGKREVEDILVLIDEATKEYGKAYAELRNVRLRNVIVGPMVTPNIMENP